MVVRKGQKVKGAAVKATKRAVGPRSEHARLVVYVKPRHVEALEDLAREQADAIGALRPDLSKAARAALDEWMDKRKR
jgi:hypothetical protein